MKPIYGFKIVRKKGLIWWALGLLLPRKIGVVMHLRGGVLKAETVKLGVWYQCKGAVKDVMFQDKFGCIGCRMFRAHGRGDNR